MHDMVASSAKELVSLVLENVFTHNNKLVIPPNLEDVATEALDEIIEYLADWMPVPIDTCVNTKVELTPEHSFWNAWAEYKGKPCMFNEEGRSMVDLTIILKHPLTNTVLKFQTDWNVAEEEDDDE